ARVEKTELKLLEHSLEIWSAMLKAAGGKSFSELLGDGQPRRWAAELLRWAVGRSPHTLPAIVLAMVEKIPALMPEAQRRAIELGQALRSELSARLGSHGVMLYPPYASCAPPHYKPLMPPFNWVYTAIFNVLELPVTQVPLGLNADGVPLGVQVAASHGNDHLTIAVALELERQFGGWVPPPN
ncbi:MAG TPA: amidase family protein, partial [Polyangia bacterium]|nr:amidase family protein [Polyangia bacterium]